MIFRRRAIPPELSDHYATFSDQVASLEAARDALMSCLPVGRVDPAPIPVGLDLLDDTLAELAAVLGEWRVPQLEAQWQGCVEAIEESRSSIQTAHRVAAASTELEELLGAVEDVDEPLGYAFKQAEIRWRELRH